MPDIQLGHRTVSYKVRHSKRARYVNFKIDLHDGLEIVIPHGLEVDNLDELLHERRTWILKHMRRLDHLREASERQFTQGEQIPYLGDDYVLDIVPKANGKRSTVARQAEYIRVRLQAGLRPHEQPEAVKAALESWYRAQAKIYIPQRVREIAQALNYEYKKISIRGQKTRWGSCSTQGNLNFNYRLMLAPPAAIDYVIVHELCHLDEMNHSPRFWALVADAFPQYRYWRRWLKENSQKLTL